MKPKDISRARTQRAPAARAAAARPPQICCRALSSAANTVLAPISSISTLTTVAQSAIRRLRAAHGLQDEIGALLAEQQRDLCAEIGIRQIAADDPAGDASR